MLNKFGLVLILLLIISIPYVPLLCQSKIIVIVSNLNKNGNFDFINAEQITSELNNERDIIATVFIADIYKSSSIKELNTLKNLLDRLKTPYYIIGEHNSFSGLQNYSSEFIHVFGSDEYIITDKNKILIGVNSVIPNYPDNAFIKVETVNKIFEELKAITFNAVYLFSNNSLSITQNAGYFLSLLENKNIISFYPAENKLSAQLNSEYNILEIGIPTAINFDDPCYFLIEEIDDTIRVVKKTIKKHFDGLQYSISIKDLKFSKVSIDEMIIDSSLTKILGLDFMYSSSIENITSTNRIYTILDNGLIYLNELNGKEKFVTEITGTIKNKPVLYKDLLLAGTAEGDLYSINSNNGEVLQIVGIGESITSDISLIEIPNLNSKTIGVVFGTSEGNIFCYDAFNFELLWKNNVSKFPIISSPLVEKDKVVFLNSNSSLYCVNSKSGSLNWKYEFPDRQNFSPKNYPLCDGKNIFSLSPEGNLFAVDLLLGRKTWLINTKSLLNQFYISSDKQRLILVNRNGMMTFYSSADGKEIIKVDFKKSNLFSFIISEIQGDILVGFSDGSLYKLVKKFVAKQLISPTMIPITSINVLSKNEFIIKDIYGKITFYKIN